MISTVSRFDTGIFSVNDIQEILYNPIYSYGCSFEPYLLFLDWFDIYLYVMALLNINLEDTKALKKSYEDFLAYIDNNICNKIEAETILDKDGFYESLKIHINSIKNFLKGKEELTISKNFILKVQIRWIYIEKMIQILNKNYRNELELLNKNQDFNRKHWNKLIKFLNAPTAYHKGKNMECLANYFLSCINGITITGANVRYLTEEIDLCFCNYSNNSVLWQIGSLVLVECKNQIKKISSKVIRNLSQLMDYKGVITSIIFTSSKLTKAAEEEISKIKNNGKYFIIFTLEDLINMQIAPLELLEQKIIDTFASSPHNF